MKIITNNKLIVSTDEKIFKPSPFMEKWLDVTIQSGESVVDRISELSGIDESTYYKWLKIPGFIEWYNEEWNKKLKSYAFKLDMIGMKNAARDYKYWEGMQKRIGNLSDEKNTLVQVNNKVEPKEFFEE